MTIDPIGTIPAENWIGTIVVVLIVLVTSLGIITIVGRNRR